MSLSRRQRAGGAIEPESGFLGPARRGPFAVASVLRAFQTPAAIALPPRIVTPMDVATVSKVTAAQVACASSKMSAEQAS